MSSLIKKAINKFFSTIEELVYGNWFNPFATIYFCFRSLPLKKAIRLPIWCYGFPKFISLRGDVEIQSPLSSGMIRINYTFPGAPSNMSGSTEINNKGKIIFNGSAIIRTGNRFVICNGATLTIGDRVTIADKINIGCFESIYIGDDVRIAHRTQIFDSNYHYIANLKRNCCMPLKRAIYIGRGCWICNSAFIQKGTVLPDYSVVASGSFVNGDYSSYPPGTFFSGCPAKPHDTDIRLINNLAKEEEINRFYEENPNDIFNLPNSINPAEWFER